MSPEAKAGYAAPIARVPRTLFSHAHADGQTDFPPDILAGIDGQVFMLLPDNWNGTDAVVLWFRGAATGAGQCDMVFNAGSCDELFNVHTITLADQAVNVVINEYECVDVTVAVAAWIALLNARDMINILVDDDLEIGIEFVGVEIQET